MIISVPPHVKKPFPKNAYNTEWNQTLPRSLHATQLIRIARSTALTSLAAFYSACWPTLIGTELGTRILNSKINWDNVVFDMEVNMIAMFAVGLVTFPYHNLEALHDTEKWIDHHPYWALSLFLTLPTLVPLMVNGVTHKHKNSELGALAIGSVITQMIMLVSVIKLIQLTVKNEAFYRGLDYLEEVIHSDHAARRFIRQAIYFSKPTNIANSVSRRGRQIRADIKASMRQVTSRVKLAIVEPFLKRALATWHAEKKDPTTYYLARSIESLDHDDLGDIELQFENAQRNFAMAKSIKESYERHRYVIDWLADQKERSQPQVSHSLQVQRRDFALMENMIMMNIDAMTQEARVHTITLLMMHDMAGRWLTEHKQFHHSNSLIKCQLRIEETKAESPVVTVDKSKKTTKKQKQRQKKLAELQEQKQPAPAPQSMTVLAPSIVAITPQADALPIVETIVKSIVSSALETIRQRELAPPVASLPASNDVVSRETRFDHKYDSPSPVMHAGPAFGPTDNFALKTISRVALNRFEKEVLSLVRSLELDGNHNHHTYIVGGWAYDKVREALTGDAPCQYSDIDIITDIPEEYLQLMFKSTPEVKGLFWRMYKNIKIDVVHVDDLTDLASDLDSRDFFPLYIDDGGNVTDPTCRAQAHMLQGVMFGIKSPEFIFKKDPLVILRTIYFASKRQLDITHLLPAIHTDRHLLVPRYLDDAQVAERILNPHRMNLYIKRLFSQRRASKNLVILNDLNLLETLFPEINTELQTNFDWVLSRMALSNAHPWPTLTIIYGTFVACAIAERCDTDECEQIYASHQTVPAQVIHIWESSLLFQDVFKDPQDLYLSIRDLLRLLRQSSAPASDKISLEEINVFMSHEEIPSPRPSRP